MNNKNRYVQPEREVIWMRIILLTKAKPKKSLKI